MKTYSNKVEKCLQIINTEYNILTDEVLKENNLSIKEIHDKLNSLQIIVGNIKKFEKEQNLKLRSDNIRQLNKITKYFLKLNGNINYYKLKQI